MNERSQMQGGKYRIFPKEMNENRFFLDSHWLEISKNHLCPSVGPNGGSVAMDSAKTSIAKSKNVHIFFIFKQSLAILCCVVISVYVSVYFYAFFRF